MIGELVNCTRCGFYSNFCTCPAGPHKDRISTLEEKIKRLEQALIKESSSSEFGKAIQTEKLANLILPAYKISTANEDEFTGYCKVVAHLNKLYEADIDMAIDIADNEATK